jgi:hypothetical protein
MHPEKYKHTTPFPDGRVLQMTNPAHQRFFLSDAAVVLATEFAF